MIIQEVRVIRGWLREYELQCSTLFKFRLRRRVNKEQGELVGSPHGFFSEQTVSSGTDKADQTILANIHGHPVYVMRMGSLYAYSGLTILVNGVSRHLRGVHGPLFAQRLYWHV